MKINDPRFNIYSDTWSAIRAVADYCPDCSRPFANRAQKLHIDDAPSERWKELLESVHAEYRQIVLRQCRGQQCEDHNP